MLRDGIGGNTALQCTISSKTSAIVYMSVLDFTASSHSDDLLSHGINAVTAISFVPSYPLHLEALASGQRRS